MSDNPDSPPLLGECSHSLDEDVVPPTQPSLWRSARIICSESRWINFPAEAISSALAAANIQPDPELNKDDLVLLAQNALGSPPQHQEADPVEDSLPPADAPPRPPTKRKSKSKHITPPARKRKISNQPANQASDQDSVLEVLRSLTEAVKGFDSRLQFLESRQPVNPELSVAAPALPVTSLCGSPPHWSSLQPAPPAECHANSNPVNPIQTPGFSLASAQPAPPQGRSFIAQAAVSVSPLMRSNILQGKDINLASLLLSSPPIDRQLVNCGDVSVILKSSDPRLLKNLSFGEFTVAFSIFRDVLCSIYPDRCAELDNLSLYAGRF